MNHRSRVLSVVFVFVFVLISTLSGQPYESGVSLPPLMESGPTVVLLDELPTDAFQPLPKDLVFQEIQIGGDGQPIQSGATGIEVYRNVNGSIFAPVGANGLIADDIQTISAGGCGMSFLEVAVFGGGNGSGPGFNVTQLKVFDECPGAGGQVIYDVLGGVPLSLPNNGGFLLTFDLESAPVQIPANFWLGLAFSTAQAGWIGGAAPTIGQSLNVIHVPAISCNATFADPSLYSAMYADIFCATAQTFFVGYQSDASSFVFLGGQTPCDLGGCGDGIDLNANCDTAADDIVPIVPNCQLHGYTVNVAGLGGPFEIEFELWSNDPSVPLTGAPLAPIPNTRGCYNGTGNGFSEQASFTFDGSVTLPPKFWLVWTDNDNDSGPIAAGAPPEVGQSGDFYAIYDSTGTVWNTGNNFGGCLDGNGNCGSIQSAVQCLGAEPTGACCDQLSGTCTEGVFYADCDGRWEASVNCAQATFDPPCGAAACCMVDPQNSMATICDNTLPSVCAMNGGESTSGQLCENVECGLSGCIGAVGDCFVVHGTGGCAYNSCCNIVCGIDPFCCNNQWDETCAVTAQQLCPPKPPVNDSCNDALSISVGILSTSTIGATTDGPLLPQLCLSAGSLILGSDIWYEFIAPGTGNLTIDLCNATDYDSRIAIYEGCSCPPTQLIGCDDDGCGAGQVASTMTIYVTSDTCYLLRVGGWGSFEQGNVELHLSLSAVCGDGVVSLGEECDGGFCCSPQCILFPADTVCHEPQAQCVAPTYCTGLSAFCPPAQFQPPSFVCRPAIGPCDLPEFCPGNNFICPPDEFVLTPIVCRGQAGPCDVAENCTGSSANCPPDGYSSGNECRPVQGDCDVAEACDGSGPDCPADGYSSGNECRPSTGECDPAEACDGAGPTCPADVVITACADGDGCCPAGCNGLNDDDCTSIPTVSEWGLIVLALAVLTVVRIRNLSAYSTA